MRVDFRGLPAARAARGPRAAQAASPPAPCKNPRRSRVFMWSSPRPSAFEGARLLRLLAATQARGLGLESARATRRCHERVQGEGNLAPRVPGGGGGYGSAPPAPRARLGYDPGLGGAPGTPGL